MSILIDNYFQVSVTAIQLLDPQLITPDNKLILYGLYQQSLYGDNLGPRPWCCYTNKLLKYQSWERHLGMSSEEAKILYIRVAEMILRHLHTSTKGIKDKKFAF